MNRFLCRLLPPACGLPVSLHAGETLPVLRLASVDIYLKYGAEASSIPVHGTD